MPLDFHRLKTSYHAARLTNDGRDLDAVAAEMARYTATANSPEWFAAWDSEATERAREMERDVGLADRALPDPEFVAAARRAIIFELGGSLRRTVLQSVAAC